MRQVLGSVGVLGALLIVLSACGGSSGGGVAPPPSLVPTVTAINPASGSTAGGDAVTITGTNFVTAATTVAIGGVAATGVNVVSATELTCTTPAHAAGAADVEATTTEGTGTLTAGYSFQAVVDAIVGNRDSNAVVIFKDVLNHSGLGGDVVLDGPGSLISNGGHMAVWNDWLAVSNRNNNTVTLYNGLSTITSGQAPDVVLSGGSCLAGITIDNGDVYVASRCSNQILIWRDVTTLVTGDPVDATLAGVSCPSDCKVVADRLFVTNRCTSTGSIQIWDGASTLVGGEAPTATIDSNSPRRVDVIANVMWIRNSNNSSAIFGYSNASTLATGAVPDRAIFGLVPTGDRGSIAVDGTDAWLGNQWDDDPPLVRLSLTAPLITMPEATVSETIIGDEAIYDVQFLAETLVCSARDGSYLVVYANARSLTTDQVPDKYLFDARMGQAKDVLLIER